MCRTGYDDVKSTLIMEGCQVGYLEHMLIDEEITDDNGRSWYCLQNGKKYHLRCVAEVCECDCHWDDLEDL